MKIHKLTLALLLLVLGTLGLTLSTRSQQTPPNKNTDSEALKLQREKKGKFPVASFEEPELTDPKKKQARKEKNLRHNDFHMVARNPPEWQAELLVTGEGDMDFPALPVEKSAYILFGEVKSAEAHVSENKKNVYSEFTVAVAKVFKTASSSLTEGAEITVDRVGGFVKYANGRSVLYRLSGSNMPTVGGRYVFFLTSANNQDLSILTAYELGPDGITPLDDSPQFEKFRGVSEDVFFQNVRDSLASGRKINHITMRERHIASGLVNAVPSLGALRD